ncbi:TonB-dependent receptor [Luteimonas chenhongjianii]|uniref:TonB-dependent receptor n=2 Tax=Luteimonas TaxID=83614 RepID=A0A290XGS0_9GAMM|nr:MULTISPECIES: TonB-dependent receptor [Luteimonas]ATD68345.1 TonB-dependent receptor [Luteimonas chenhongjianii]RPD87971.1 TonB-dependent receptor [Luteimonas sp. 100069]
MMLRTTKLRDAVTLALFTTATLAASTGTALAQSEPQATTLDRVEVTGSRIRSVDAETSQPVQVIDRATIEKQGLTSVAEVLQRISSNGAALNRTFNNGGDGSSEVSLRNLGSARTLVLVDGRRWVSTLGGSVDLNTIPAAIIERIEVLKDGASSIYGSDAIAGVVNIITRENYQGAELRTHYGQFSQGDGERKSVELTIGSNGERGNVVFSLSRVEEEAVMAGDRAFSRDPVRGLGASQYSGYSSNGKIWNAGPLDDGDDGWSEYLIVPPNATGIGPAGQQRYGLDQTVPWSAASYAYNYAKDNYLLTPQTRTSAYTKARYDLTDTIAVRAEALYNERRSQQQLAGFPLTGGAGFGDPDAAMSPDSYFNPYNPAYGGDGRAVEWSHRLTEQARVYDQNVKTFHTYVGLEGTFDFADRFFSWDVGYNFNKSDQTDRQIGDANMLNVAAGVGPSELRDGRVVCVTGPGGDIIDGCVPFNPLSPAGGVSQEMLDYILFTAQDVYQNRTESFTANMSGDMFTMPGGTAGFAVGIESRRESGFDSPDAFVAAGLTSGNGRKPTAGSYDLDEIYAEVLLPLLSDVTGAQLLELSLASRYSDYSNFGDTTNSKAGFKWKPIDDLLIRGNWSEGFRAPPISTLFRGLADSYTQFGDICSADYEGRTGTIAANCLADGVPADFIQRTNTGLGYFGQTIFPFSIGGNPNAGPETSISKTAGFVYSPSFIESLNITVDWWNIKIENALSTPSAAYILDQCYAQGDQAWCDLFSRRAADNQIDFMLLAPQNLSVTEVEGWDVNVSYTMPETNFGNFGFALDTSYVSKWDSQFTPESEVSSAVGNYYESDPNWRLRANASLDWSYGDFSASWMTRYMSGLNEACAFPGRGLCTDEDRRTAEGPAPRNRLGATTYHDVQVRYQLPWNGTVKLGANNVFKKDPPFATQAFANSFDYQYDIPDSRYMYMEYVQRF